VDGRAGSRKEATAANALAPARSSGRCSTMRLSLTYAAFASGPLAVHPVEGDGTGQAPLPKLGMALAARNTKESNLNQYRIGQFCFVGSTRWTPILSPPRLPRIPPRSLSGGISFGAAAVQQFSPPKKSAGGWWCGRTKGAWICSSYSPARGAPSVKRVQPVNLNTLKADHKNDRDATDIVCNECKSVLVTLHARRAN
jgi:hypothetical protein